MDIKSIYSDDNVINEGGHAVKSSPVRNDTALRMINWLRNGIKSSTGLETASAGSAGKKQDDEYSGDIDIIIGAGPDKGMSAIQEYISNVFGKGIETRKSKGLNLLSCSLPFKDEKGNDSHVQVDFFFYPDIRMAEFFYHSPDYRCENPSIFKGSVRNRLLSEIASVIPTGKKSLYFDSTDYVREFWKYSYTPQGLMLKHKSFEGKKGQQNRNSHTIKEDTQKVTSDPAAVVRFLLGKNATEKDADSFESIVNFMNSGNFRFPELKDKIFKNLIIEDDDPDERKQIENFLTRKINNQKLSESINAQRKMQGSADDYERRRNKKIIKDTTDAILDAKYMVPEKVKNGFFENKINVDFISDENELVNELETDILKSIDYKCEDAEKYIKDYPEFNPQCFSKIETSTNNQKDILNLTTLIFSRYYSNQELFKFTIDIWQSETYINSHRYVLIKCESQGIELYIQSLEKLQKALSFSPDRVSAYHYIKIVPHDPYTVFAELKPLNRKSYIQLIQYARFFLSQEFYIFIYRIEHMEISQQLIKKLSDADIHISESNICNYLLIQMICEEFPQIAPILIKVNHILLDEKSKKLTLFLKDYFMKQIHGNKKDINDESVSESINAQIKNKKKHPDMRGTNAGTKIATDLILSKLGFGKLPENMDEFNQDTEKFISMLLKKNKQINPSDYERYYTFMPHIVNPVSGAISGRLLFFSSEIRNQEIVIPYDIDTKNDEVRYTEINQHIGLTLTVGPAWSLRKYNITISLAYFKTGNLLLTNDIKPFMYYLHFLQTIYSKKFMDIMHICDQIFNRKDILFFEKYTGIENETYFFKYIFPCFFLYGFNHEFPDIFTFDNLIKVQKHYEIPFEQNFTSDKDGSKFTYKYILQSLKVQIENIWHYWFSGESSNVDREKFMKDNSVDMVKPNKSLLETFHYFSRKLSESINAQRKLQGSADDDEKRRNKKIIKDTTDAILDAKYMVPEKVRNGFYDDIKKSKLKAEEENTLITELENHIIGSIGNYQNKKSIKEYYSCTIEHGKYTSPILRTMTFNKFEKTNLNKPLYQFNIQLEERTSQIPVADNPMGYCWLTSWKCYLYNIVFETNPLFIKQLSAESKYSRQIRIDKSQDWNDIPSISRNSYIQLINKANVLLSPEFYDFICKLMTVTISKKIIEKLKASNIKFHDGTCYDIIIRMICQKFPVFSLKETLKDEWNQASLPKWEKIEIFMKDYLLNQMYGNTENTQNDSAGMIDESMNAIIKRKKNLPDMRGTDAGTKIAIDLQLAKEGIRKIPTNSTEFIEYTSPLLKHTIIIATEDTNFETKAFEASVYLDSDKNMNNIPSFGYKIQFCDGIYWKSELSIRFEMETEIKYGPKDYIYYHLPFKAEFLNKPVYSDKTSYLNIMQFMKYMDNNKAYARIFQIFESLESQDTEFFKDYLYCHFKTAEYYDVHVLKYLVIYIINRTFPDVFTMDNFVKIQNDYASKNQTKGIDIMNVLHDRFENIYKYWFSGKHDVERDDFFIKAQEDVEEEMSMPLNQNTYVKLANDDFRKKRKVNESMDAWRKHAMKHSDDPHPEKITRKIVENDLSTKICQKYNDGKIYDFNYFNHLNFFKERQSYTFTEITEYVSNLCNVISNYFEQNLKLKNIYNEFKFQKKYEYDDNYMNDFVSQLISSDGKYISLCRIKYIFDNTDKKECFIHSLTLDYIPAVKETFNATIDFNINWILYDFSSIDSPIKSYKIFTLARLNDYNIDAFAIAEIFKNLNGVIEYIKDFLQPGFIKFYQLLNNIANLGFCFEISFESQIKNQPPKMAYITHKKENVDGSSIIRAISNENNIFHGSLYFKQLRDVVKDDETSDFFESFGKCISAIFQGVCCKNEKAAKWFHQGESYLPAAEFIDDIFTENNMICPDGHVPVSMEEVLKVAGTNPETDTNFKCTESATELFSSDAVYDEYEGLDNFKDYN